MHRAHKNSKRFLRTISQAVTTSASEEQLAVVFTKLKALNIWKKEMRSYSVLDETECFFQSWLFGLLVVIVCFLVESRYIVSNL